MLTAQNVHDHLQKYGPEIKRACQFIAPEHTTIVMGPTGGGKSTICNVLKSRSIKADNFNIEVQEEEKTSFKIGHVGSETMFPQHAAFGEKHSLYDMPGFGDTRGVLFSTLNAAFLRRIVLTASTVNFVLVVSQSDVTSGRGELITQTMKSLRELLPDNDILAMSTLVITRKSGPEAPAAYFQWLQSKVDHKVLDGWEHRWAAMSFAQVDEKELEHIRDVVRRQSARSPVSHVNVDVVLRGSEHAALKNFFLENFRSILAAQWQIYQQKLDAASSTEEVENIAQAMPSFVAVVPLLAHAPMAFQLVAETLHPIYDRALQKIQSDLVNADDKMKLEIEQRRQAFHLESLQVQLQTSQEEKRRSDLALEKEKLLTGRGYSCHLNHHPERSPRPRKPLIAVEIPWLIKVSLF